MFFATAMSLLALLVSIVVDGSSKGTKEKRQQAGEGNPARMRDADHFASDPSACKRAGFSSANRRIPHSDVDARR